MNQHQDAAILAEMTSPEPNSGCWLWMGYVDGDGYGQWPNLRAGGRKAHRISFELANGRRPVGLVCHKCDVRSCINPSHLFEGSAALNNADMVCKKRHVRGEKVNHAKLTAEQVVAIRNDRRSLRATADAYGVSRSLIGAIRARKIWHHV